MFGFVEDLGIGPAGTLFRGIQEDGARLAGGMGAQHVTQRPVVSVREVGVQVLIGTGHQRLLLCARPGLCSSGSAALVAMRFPVMASRPGPAAMARAQSKCVPPP